MTMEHHLDPTPYTPRDCYLGNPLIRRFGSRKTEWTDELLREYQRCREDIEYFCSTYVMVMNLDKGLMNFVPYPYQRKMWKLFRENRFNIVLACRQSGKTIGVVGYLLWYTIFHSDQTVAVAAHTGGQAREIMERYQTALENLPFFLQPEVRTYNKSSVVFANGTRIFSSAATGRSLRGKAINLLYLDEFAFVEHDAAFMTGTYPVISSGKTSKIIITSTANGIGNQFHKLWEGSIQEKNTFKNMRVDWWDVPGRDEKWKADTIANTSRIQFEQEFGNCLGADSVVTVRVGGADIYDIRLGDLYDAARAQDTCGLHLDEEIRLKAIRRHDI